MHDFVLTDHARKRIAQRRIELEWVEKALNHPARIESDLDDETLMHVLLPIAERGFRVLRVIYNETVNPCMVVTAYFDNEVTDL